MSGTLWHEVGDRIYRRNYESLDLNIGLVLSDEDALVIDSRASHGQAEELLSEVRELTGVPVGYLVNTHHHWDHTFGNACFGTAEIVGHVRCRRTLIERGEEMRQKLLSADWMPEEAKPHLAEVDITPPEVVFEDEMTINVGDREVSLRYLGKGHTDNDIVATIDDVLFAGDLVEQGGPPQFGDSFPAEWLETLQTLADRVSGVVVPGHGQIVDREFVIAQRDEISRAIEGERVFPEPVMRQLRARLKLTGGSVARDR